MPKRKRASFLKSKGSIASVMALWLTGIFVASAVSRIHVESGASFFLPSDLEETLIYMTGVTWPLLYFLFSSYRFFPKHPPMGVLINISLFFLFAALSAFVSSSPYISIGYLVLTFLAIWIVLQFNTNMMAADFDKAFKVYSMLIGISMVFYIFFVYTPNVRLGEDQMLESKILNPNSIGMICMSGFISALAFQNLFTRAIVLGVCGTILIMTASRASTLGSIVGVAVFLWSRRKEWGMTHYLVFWWVVLFILIVAVVWWNPLIVPVKTYFAMHDRTRGLATGAGRFVVWGEAWELFLSHPLFGVGYRAHEELIRHGSSAHNGYLGMLAEIGVIGSAALIYPIWKGIKFLRHKNTFEPAVSYAVLVSLCMGYLYVAFFERFLINFGNPTSILFLISLFSYLIPYGEPRAWRSSSRIGRIL